MPSGHSHLDPHQLFGWKFEWTLTADATAHNSRSRRLTRRVTHNYGERLRPPRARAPLAAPQAPRLRRAVRVARPRLPAVGQSGPAAAVAVRAFARGGGGGGAVDVGRRAAHLRARRVGGAARARGEVACIVVAGESGAGKTEAAKLLLLHLLHRVEHGDDDAELTELRSRLVLCRAALEPFTHASGAANANASRAVVATRVWLEPARPPAEGGRGSSGGGGGAVYAASIEASLVELGGLARAARRGGVGLSRAPRGGGVGGRGQRLGLRTRRRPSRRAAPPPRRARRAQPPPRRGAAAGGLAAAAAVRRRPAGRAAVVPRRRRRRRRGARAVRA